MADEDLPPFQAPALESCYRHPGVETGVHCTRCGKPICPDCMVPAPVGYQCPGCVEEARSEFRKSGAGPQQIRSMSGTPVTFGLLAVIGGVFLVDLAMKGQLFQRGADVPGLVAAGETWRLMTAVFLHGGIMHLLLNGYGLYLFGGFVERTFGHLQLLALFLVTGFVASVTSYALSPISEEGLFTPAIGASGAIFGLFGVFLAYNFRRRHTRLGRAMLQQMLPWLLLNVVLSFVPGIDWRAHFGGLVAGFLAGFAAEELAERISRRAAFAIVYSGLVVIGVAAAVWKTGAILEAVPELAGALT